MEVFNCSSVTSLFGVDIPADHREFILLEFIADDIEMLSSALIRPVQLDSDAEDEFIVQAYAFPKHIYLIYDRRGLEWQLIQTISQYDKSGAYPEIDTMINGYIGLTELYYSWGVGDEHINYYTLKCDSLEEVFTITKSHFFSPFTSADLYSFEINVECEWTYHANIVDIEYTITFYYRKGPSEAGYLFDVSHHTYNLILNEKGNVQSNQTLYTRDPFAPDPSLNFDTNIYGYDRLMYLKTHGSRFQRKALKNFLYLM